MKDSDLPANLQWHVIYTKPRQEKKVFASLQNTIIESFLPLRRERRKWSDRWKWIEVPLFSSYIFVRPTPHQREIVLQTDGVVRYLWFNGRIGVVRKEEIELLHKVIVLEEKIEVIPDLFNKEQKVRITKGPLAGYTGRYLHTADSGNRIALRIEEIGYSVVVHVAQGDLESVK